MIKQIIIGIYKITSPSGKIYIGQSSNIYKRWRWYNTISNCKEQLKLYNSFLKYGIDNHIFEVVFECSKESLNDLEIYYGNIFNVTGKNGLNLRECGGAKAKHSIETRKKMSERQMGDKNHNYGKKISIETKMKMSQALKGEKNPLYNKPLTEETRQKMSEAQKGEKSHRYGKKDTEEVRIKKSKSALGKPKSEQHKKNLRKPKSKEAVKNNSEAQKRYWENIRQERAVMIF